MSHIVLWDLWSKIFQVIDWLSFNQFSCMAFENIIDFYCTMIIEEFQDNQVANDYDFLKIIISL